MSLGSLTLEPAFLPIIFPSYPKYFLSAIMSESLTVSALEEDLILLGCRSQDLRMGSPLWHSTL